MPRKPVLIRFEDFPGYYYVGVPKEGQIYAVHCTNGAKFHIRIATEYSTHFISDFLTEDEGRKLVQDGYTIVDDVYTEEDYLADTAEEAFATLQKRN